jgi:predicted dehydrogenase
MRTPISVGVVGLGHAGRNLARMFHELPQATLRWLADDDLRRTLELRAHHPSAQATGDIDDLLGDDELDAVVIATPARTHASLVERALVADKHVLVQTPLALSAQEADRLGALAERRGRSLVVGHTLLFHPAVRKLKELIAQGRLGELFYLYCNRHGLGTLRGDANALWSLGPHDVSVLLYLLEDEPIEVSARGEAYVQEGIEDVVFCYLRFATGISAHLQLSWLDPHKMRRLSAVGSQRMAVIDDTESERKLTIYERGVPPSPSEALDDEPQVASGDIVSPRLPDEEPLRLECEHFVRAVRSGRHAGTREAAAVVGVLDALQQSLDRDGASVAVGRPGGSMLALENVARLVREAPSA